MPPAKKEGDKKRLPSSPLHFQDRYHPSHQRLNWFAGTSVNKPHKQQYVNINRVSTTHAKGSPEPWLARRPLNKIHHSSLFTIAIRSWLVSW